MCKRHGMDPASVPFTEALMSVDEIFNLIKLFFLSILTPGWRQYQVFIIVGLAVLAYLMHGLLGNMVDARVRQREGWSKWQLRAIVQVKRRLGLIAFAVMTYAVYAVMQQVTWPSRSYLIGNASTLAAAWIGIAFAVRLVRNRFLRRMATWGLWIWVTLYFLGVIDEFSEFLDRLALEVGDFRISLLSLITAAIVIGALFVLARVASTATASSIRKNEDISPSMQVLAVKGVQVAVLRHCLLLRCLRRRVSISPALRFFPARSAWALASGCRRSSRTSFPASSSCSTSRSSPAT